MLQNHFKFILRSFSRSKSHTFLNLFGLTSGLIVFIIISLYTNYEFSFDKHNDNLEHIYRVYKADKDNYYKGSNRYAVTPGPLANALIDEFPEVQTATRITNWGNTLIKANDVVFMEPAINLSDPATFDIFSFEAVTGDLSTFLKEKNEVALSESIAMKYFGSTDVLGEVIYFRNKDPMVVSGVFKDMPKNSHFIMDVVFNFDGIMELNNQNTNRWNNSSYHTFLLLNDGAESQLLQDKLPQLRAKYADDPIDEDGQETEFFLQPMADVHFTEGILFDIAPSASPQNLYIYLSIAFMVLIIASINYVNLTTAKAINRTKEIGIKKVVGAESKHLVLQFLLESFVLIFMSLVIAILVLLLILPAFSQFIDRPLALDFTDPNLLLLFMALTFGLSLFAGMYPSWVLASFKPISALKGKSEMKHRGAIFRNILVVFQFVISSGLIISAAVLSEQLSFIRSADTGFAKDQIIVLNLRDQKIREQMSVFQDELLTIPGVISASGSSSLPNNISSSTNARWPGKDKELRIPIYTGSVGYDFFDVYEMDFIEGGAFQRDRESDKTAVVLNEAAIDAFGWNDPIGKLYISSNTSDTGRVVGVVKNFNQHSLHLGVAPVQLFLNESQRRISIKVAGNDLKSTLSAIEDKYNAFNSAYPFDYSYFNDIFDRAYLNEAKTFRLAQWFTALTILVACLGLYGLAAHKVQQRIKEVGVRKVLGASVPRILTLLSQDFIKLLLIAFCIAAPVAYYIMNGWLEGFAFHIDIGFMTILSTLIMMILVAGLTVGYRTYRAAVRNPVEALREE